MAGRTFLDNLMLSAAGVSPFMRKAIGSVSEAVEPDPQVTNRMSMLPFGNYSDGSVGFAWPQSLIDSQEALQRFGSGQAPQPQDAVLAGLAMAGSGLGHLGLRGRLAGSAAGAERAEASSGLPSHSVEAGRAALPAEYPASAATKYGDKIYPRRAHAPDAAPTGMLAMDAASRMERARAMGFDTDKTWYHGTTADIGAFDPSRTGETFKVSGRDKIYFADHPGYASDVAAWKAGKSGGAPAVYPVYLRGADPWPLAGPTSEAVIVDPKNIRSVNAAFDPAKSDSANLLAVNPPDAAPAGLLATDNQQPTQQDFLIELLRRHGFMQ
jgi:hypothetical protein